MNKSTSSESGRILTVDSEPTTLCAFEYMLRMWGYQVMAARSARDAMELLAISEKPDAAIIGCELDDDEWGVAVLDELQRMHGPGTPAVFITGNIDSARVRKAVGNRGLVLEMPVPPAVLRPMLEAICGAC